MTIVSFGSTSLEDFCKGHSSFKTKIALLSFYKVNFSKWTDKMLLILEYLQLMSQIVLSFDYEDKTEPWLSFRIIIYLFKLVNPGYLLTFDKQDSWTFTLLIIIFIGVLFKLMLFAYIVCASLRYFNKFSWLIFLWKWIFKLQTRGIYFLFTSLYLKAIIASLEGFTPTPLGKDTLISISCFVILIEFLFSLMIETQFCYFLPDKNFLSSKGGGLQIITLVQKLVIQLLLTIFRSDSEAGAWVISCFSLVFNVGRASYCYRFLPLYRFKALLLQGNLLSIMLCLNLAQFADIIRRSVNNNQQEINFAITIGIICSILAQKISSEVFKTRLIKILCTNNASSEGIPEVLIHKIIATEELKKYERIAAESTEKYHFTQLISGNQDARIAEIFGLENCSSEAREIGNIYQSYCEILAKRFPQNGFVKLHLAKIYFKSHDPSRFPAIIKILNELTQNKWSEYYLTSSLLMYEVENSILWIQHPKEENQHELDMFTFIRNKLYVERLKKEVLREIELYLNVSKNILSDVSDLGEIYNLAQLIGESKISIKKLADKLFKELPDCYVSPLLICARYHLLLNYSLANFDKYMEGFAQRFHKNERYFKASKLIQENLYQETNGFVLLSSQENDCGKIVYCTKSFQALCGSSEGSRYVGTKIYNLFPSGLRAYYENLLKEGKDKALNTIHHGYLSYMNKYLIEVDFCLKYHPYLHQNLCFSMIVRPAEAKEFLLLSENGNIEGASKEISKLLGLYDLSKPINIKLLSKELNQMLRTQNKIKKGEEDSSHKRVQISPYQSEFPSSYKFYCHFEPFFADEICMFSVILERIKEEISESPKRNSKIDELFFSNEYEAQENQTQVDLPLFSLQTENREFLVKNGHHRQSEIIPMTPKSQAMFSNLNATNGDDKTQEDHKDKIKKYLSSSSGHNSQQNSLEKASDKAFKAAMESKSYPKPFITLTIFFYAAIVSTFLGQIIMKVVCDKTLDDLGVKKDFLLTAEERSYREMLLQINALATAFQINGTIPTNGILVNPAVVSVNLALHADALQIANDEMIEKANKLDESIQKRLFVPNVRMYGTYLSSEDYDYETMTTFQAAEKIINAVKTFNSVTYATLNTTGFHSMFYITRNVLGDLEYENQKIVEILQDSVLEEKQSYEFITIFCLILTPLLLIGIGVMLTGITIHQYRIEKQQMKTLIRVRSSGMQEISDCIRKFQKSLINEEDLTTTHYTLFQEDINIVISLQKERATSGYSKQHDTRTIKYEKFRKRYIQYIVKIFLYLAPLLAINIWDWISTTNANKIIYHKMDQIQFAQYIGNQVTFTYGSEVILFDTNNTFQAKHKTPEEIVKHGIVETKLLQEEIYDRFKELDGSFNKKIKDIIYKDNTDCNRFIGPGLRHCNTLVKLGQRTNMMSTITIFQSTLVTKLQDYYNVRNKTSMKDFINASFINLNFLLPPFVLTAHQTQFIVAIIDDEITKKMQDTKENRSNILVVFSLCLVIVSVLFWLQILKKIKEVYNNFKKVLKIFPPGLILSSYLLKKFVISTSNQSKL